MPINQCFAGTTLLLLLSGTVLADDRIAEVKQRFERQNYQAVLTLLDDSGLSDHPEASRLRAMALFHLPDHAAALPLLERLHRQEPDDGEVLAALAEASLTRGQLDQADQHARRMTEAGMEQHGGLLRARIAEERSDWSAAESHYQAAIGGPSPRLSRAAAQALADMFNRRQQPERAEQVVTRARTRLADPLSTVRQDDALPPTPGRPLAVRLGYRLEHDDNVPQASDDLTLYGIDDAEGLRHVFSGDINYQHALIEDALTLYAEAYLYQNWHQESELHQFNFSRATGVLGLGGTGQRFGWRVPVELSWEGLDGDRYQTSVTASPGIFMQVTPDWLILLFARFGEHDFISVPRPSEDRSGSRQSAGLFMHAKPLSNLQWRLTGEFSVVDADGNNWEHDEWRLLTSVEYQLQSDWSAMAGFYYAEADFDNLHDLFLQHRSDDSWGASAQLSWQFADRWRALASYNYLHRDSNIDFFQARRNVFSLGLVWEL